MRHPEPKQWSPKEVEAVLLAFAALWPQKVLAQVGIAAGLPLSRRRASPPPPPFAMTEPARVAAAAAHAAAGTSTRSMSRSDSVISGIDTPEDLSTLEDALEAMREDSSGGEQTRFERFLSL